MWNNGYLDFKSVKDKIMAENEINYDTIQRQLGILMTNSVAFSGKMYDLLASPTPMDVELRVWTSENEFETITVPNRAKGSIPALYGKGNPEGVQEASYGAIYLDEDTKTVYIKTSLTGATGWLKLITTNEMNIHDQNNSAHEGVLAKIHGDPEVFFRVANLDIHADDNGSYVVNKDSLFALLGGLDQLKTNDKTDVVSAINEAIEISTFDAGCVNSGALIADSNQPDLIVVNGTARVLTVLGPIICRSAEGYKYEINTDLQYDLLKANLGKNSVYIDLDKMEIVLLQGEYFVSAHKPYFMQGNDCWLNIGIAPYKFQQMVLNETTHRLSLETKNYVYVGTVDWRG